MRWTVVAAGLVLSACGQPDERAETDAAAGETVEAAETPAQEPETVATQPEWPQCFFEKTTTETVGLEIDRADSGAYRGQYFGTVHNEELAYYTAFDGALSNGVQDEATGALTFDQIMEVDGDTQTEPITWILSEEGARQPEFDNTLPRSPCVGLYERVWPPITE